MTIKPIKTESDYRMALKRLEEIFDAPIGTEEREEADILGLLVPCIIKHSVKIGN